ncbi:hypothetical protein PM082_013685 [Marasmius tenuissimus]|nr:hypothetical protein PM082_013685 [Marasmius tenuissimus]
MVVVVTVFRTQEAALEYNFATTREERPFIHYALDVEPKLAYYTLYFAVPPLANIVAECMLIHRCYLIWGRKKRVAIPLVLLSAIGSLFFLAAGIVSLLGYRDRRAQLADRLITYGDVLRFVGLLISAVVNVSVTFLTAGRIWRVNRESQKHLRVTERNSTVAKGFSTAICIVLESGIIYPAVMIVQIAVGSPEDGRLPPVDLYPAVVLSAGIAPTLALLRAQLAKLYKKSGKHSLESTSGIRFNSSKLVELGGKSSGNHSISLQAHANIPGEKTLKPPEPLVYPRQGTVASFTRSSRWTRC